MNKFTKAIAAIMLIVAAIIVASCTKGSFQGHQYVDLGLPSGTLWATCNIGAVNPEDYGDCFAWGETESKEEFTFGNYKFFDGDSILKYNHYDGLTMLEEEDDAATANWGSGWCMPSEDDWWELANNTVQTWTVRYGVYGRLFTASNGREVFFPAMTYPSLQGNYRIEGQYWINHGGGGFIITYIRITSEGCMLDATGRWAGLFVRPVRSKH